MTERRAIDWNEYTRLALTMCERLRMNDYLHRGHPIEGVYGIPRGGTFLAIVISHLTGLKFYSSWPISARVLVVDDIVDTGFQMGGFIVQNFATASMFLREGCSTVPWIHVAVAAPGIHIVFPYETEMSTYKSNG